jgi:MFS family permease
MMTAVSETNVLSRNRRRATLGTSCSTHVIHDGFTDLTLILLPFWQAEFALSLTQIGVIKTAYSGTMAVTQLPAGLAAERLGERGLLTAGTLLAGAGFMLFGLAGGMAGLILAVVIAGIGAGTQHPLNSAIVARAYQGGGRRAALGIFNFSGDVGKVIVPAGAALVIGVIGWKAVAVGYGAIGAIAGVVIFFLMLRLGAGARVRPEMTGTVLAEEDAPAGSEAAATGWGLRHRRGFAVLSAIGIIDAATRTGLLTFLPFLLISKGASVESLGLALALIFSGGAAGKLVCGLLAERVGIVRTAVLTEAATGVGILVLLALPLNLAFVLLPFLGIALNGTSSVLYATVAEFVDSRRHSRGFGLFMTMTIGASALSPTIFGVISDLNGVPAALTIVAVLALLTLPLCVGLRRPLAEAGEA